MTAPEAAAVAGAYREVFGHLPTGVTIIAAREAGDADRAGRIAGMVVGTFSSLSLEPPLVSFMVMNESRSWARIREIGSFTASILASDQSPVCTILAGRDPDRFERVDFRRPGLVLEGCIAWAECRITEVVEAGDHSIVVASTSALEVARPQARPLVFYRRAYHRPFQVEDFPAPGWW